MSIFIYFASKMDTNFMKNCKKKREHLGGNTFQNRKIVLLFNGLILISRPRLSNVLASYIKRKNIYVSFKYTVKNHFRNQPIKNLYNFMFAPTV